MTFYEEYLLLDEDDLNEIEQGVDKESDPKKKGTTEEQIAEDDDEEDEEDEDSEDAEDWDTDEEEESA